MESKRDNQRRKGGLPGKNISLRLEQIDNKFISDGGSFKSVKAKTLFRVKSNPQLDKSSFKFSDNSTYPYFTRTIFNNGILGYVDYFDDDHLVPGNSIAVGMMGMRFFYMDKDFYAGQFTKTLFPLFEQFDRLVALWFITWFNCYSDKYKSLLVRDFEAALYDTDILIPIKNGALAIDYMRSRMRELEELRMRELEAYLFAAGFENCELNEQELSAISSLEKGEIKFVPMKIYDTVFKVTNSHNILKSSVKFGSGSTPYVTAGVGNNSIAGYISYNEDMLEPGNSIMIGGKTMVITYQPDEFFSNDSHNLVLRYIDREYPTENQYLFGVAALYKSLSHIYSWGDSISKAKIQKDVVCMPVDEDGDIDFTLMDNLINAVKKNVIARLKSQMAKEQNDYKRAINS
jgi:hypothetical protein